MKAWTRAIATCSQSQIGQDRNLRRRPKAQVEANPGVCCGLRISGRRWLQGVRRLFAAWWSTLLDGAEGEAGALIGAA
jgi:hypothetical protein